MPLKVRKPLTPGQRGQIRQTTDDITTSKPKEVSAQAAQEACGQKPKRAHYRPSQGRRTQAAVSRHRLQAQQARHFGRGRLYRVRPQPLGAYRAGQVPRWRLALHSGSERAPCWKPGRSRGAGAHQGGQRAALRAIPAGTQVHNIELHVGRGGQIVRGAGTSAQVLAKEGRYTLLRLPSGEVRNVLSDCMATVGQLSAPDHKNTKLGKAGASVTWVDDHRCAGS